MIKKLKKSQLMKKISIIILIVFSISFLVPTYSQAGFISWLGDKLGETIGGVLAKPVLFFSRLLGDAVINLLQEQFIDGAGKAVSSDNSQKVLSALEELKQYYLNNSDSFLSEEDREKLKNGTEEEKEEVEDKIIEKVETKTEVSAYTGQRMYNPGDGNKDADFYGGNIKKLKSNGKYYVSLSQIELLESGNAENYAKNYLKGFYKDNRDSKLAGTAYDNKKNDRDDQTGDGAFIALAHELISEYNKDKTKFYAYDIDGNEIRADKTDEIEKALNQQEGIQDEEQRLIDNVVKARKELLNGDSDLYLNIQYSPARIFGNKIPFLDANFITTPQDGSIAKDIQGTIATWYVALRNLSLVILLSVLVYVGIRIVLSSTAGETAKYKTMLRDWLVAMCLLFFLHYMMAFFVEASQRVTDFLSTGTDEVFEGDNRDEYMEYVREEAEDTSTSKKLPNVKADGDLIEAFGFTLLYLLLVFYTLMFTWKYLKRLIYLAFLTVIAPMVAMTYPIDKIRDGSAQAYNMWFKEYLFNILLQPVHLLLYTVLVGVSRDFSEIGTDGGGYKYVIYAIVALAFMLEAEKIIKSFFGFDKAKGGGLGAAITGGAIFGAAAGLLNRGGKAKSSNNMLSNKRDNSSEESGNGIKPETLNARDVYGNLGDDSPDNGGSNGGLDSGLNNRGDNDSNNGSTRPFDLLSSEEQASVLDAGYDPDEYGRPTPSSTQADNVNDAEANNHDEPEVQLPPPPQPQPTPQRRRPNRLKGYSNVAGRFIDRHGASILKNVARAYGAATLGTMGLAAGLASDNDGDVLKYAGVGMAAGGSLGGRSADALMSAPGKIKEAANNARDDYEIGAYGEISKDRLIDREISSKQNEEWLKRTYGSDWKKHKEDLKNSYKRLGNIKDARSSLKLRKDNPGMSAERADFSIQNINKAFNGRSYNKYDEKDQKIINKFANEVSGGNKKVAEAIIQDMNAAVEYKN